MIDRTIRWTLSVSLVLALAGCGPSWTTVSLKVEDLRQDSSASPVASPVDPSIARFERIPIDLVKNAVGKFPIYGQWSQGEIHAPPGWRLGLAPVGVEIRHHRVIWADGQPAFASDLRTADRRAICVVPDGVHQLDMLQFEGFQPDQLQRMGPAISIIRRLPASRAAINLAMTIVLRSSPVLDAEDLRWLDRIRKGEIRPPDVMIETIDREKACCLQVVRTELGGLPSDDIPPPAYLAARIFELSGYSMIEPMVDVYRSSGDKDGAIGWWGILPGDAIGEQRAVQGCEAILDALKTTPIARDRFRRVAEGTLARHDPGSALALAVWCASHDDPAMRLAGIENFREWLRGGQDEAYVQRANGALIIAAYARVPFRYRPELAALLMEDLVPQQIHRPVTTQQAFFRCVVDTDLEPWIAGQDHAHMPFVLRHALLRSGDAAAIERARSHGLVLPNEPQVAAEAVDSGLEDLAVSMLSALPRQPEAWCTRIAGQAARRGMPRALQIVCSQYPDRIKIVDYLPYLAAAGTVGGIECCVAQKYRFDAEAPFWNTQPCGELYEFRDEAGWIERIVRAGLVLDTPTAEGLFQRMVHRRYAHALRAMLQLGLPRRFVGRFLLTSTYGSAAYALPRIRLLLELGLDADLPQMSGPKLILYPWADTRSPLGDAVLAGSPEIVDLLLSHGVDPEKTACGQLKPADILPRIVCTEEERARVGEALQRRGRPSR